MVIEWDTPVIDEKVYDRLSLRSLYKPRSRYSLRRNMARGVILLSYYPPRDLLFIIVTCNKIIIMWG